MPMLAASLVALLSSLLTAEPSVAQRPNIVVILVDDMGFSDIGCYGSEIPTPNIDALANNGLRYRQFYNTGRCCPTRAALLTGLYSHQAGVGHMNGDDGVPGYRGRLNDRCRTIAEVLRLAGYFTAISGKWHVGADPVGWPRQRGFDRFYGSSAGGIHYDLDTLSYRPLIRDDEIVVQKGEPMPDGFYATHSFTEAGIEFIDEALEAEKPFFLYLAHMAPHFPLQAPAATIERFRGRYRAGWDALQAARHERQLDAGIVEDAWPRAPRPDGVKAWDAMTEQQRDRMDLIMAIYAALMFEMDRSIGRLVAALRERGVLDDTLILFLSDNGGNAESGPMGRLKGGDRPGGPKSNVFCGKGWAWAQNTPFRRFKHYVHEGGIATPLIVHWPNGIPAERVGTWVEEPGHVVDILATCADVAEADVAKLPTPPAGVSLRPTFAGGELQREAPLFWEHEGNRAVRKGRWKLVARGVNGPWELYDLIADRTESRDRAAEHPELVESLAAAWQAWAERCRVVPYPERGIWRKIRKK